MLLIVTHKMDNSEILVCCTIISHLKCEIHSLFDYLVFAIQVQRYRRSYQYQRRLRSHKPMSTCTRPGKRVNVRKSSKRTSSYFKGRKKYSMTMIKQYFCSKSIVNIFSYIPILVLPHYSPYIVDRLFKGKSTQKGQFVPTGRGRETGLVG